LTENARSWSPHLPRATTTWPRSAPSSLGDLHRPRAL